MFAYALVGLLILVLCIMESQDGLPVFEMTLYPCLCLGLFLLGCFLTTRMEKFLEKYQKYLFPIFMVIYTFMVFRLTMHSRGIPVHDSASVIKGAQYMAGLSEESNWTYFGRWNNNIMPMIFLSIAFRVGNMLGFADVYYFVLILNVMQVLVVLFCIYKLGARYSKHSAAAAWLGMGMFIIYVPILAFTQSLYTDSFSFSFGISAFYIWFRNRERQQKQWQFWVWNIVAGLLWAIGFEMKATALISFIAVLIYMLLFDSWKNVAKNAIGLLTPVVIVAVICSNYIKTLPSSEYDDTWGVPRLQYFIGIGLEGDGSFDMYSEYFLGVTETYGMEAKEAFSTEFILSHIDAFWNREHMVAKLRKNFASGTLNASDFLNTAENNGFVYNCVSYSGAYRRVYRTWVTAYWYMLLMMLVVACICRPFTKKHGAEKPEVFIPIMSMCGIMMYVMLCEANNRQLYNHLPWLFCCANMGIWSLYGACERFLAKLKEYVSARKMGQVENEVEKSA